MPPTIHQWAPAVRQRIRRAADEWFAQAHGDRNAKRRTRPNDNLTYLATIKEDINAGQTGTAEFNGEERDVYNPGLKVWANSLALVQFLAVAKVRQPVIIQSFAATRIRGTAAEDIAPGTSGTINNVVPINGTFTPTTATVQLPTVHVTVKSGMPTWAELYVDNVWRVYSADCPGEA